MANEFVASFHCPILYFLVVENIIIPLAVQIVNGLIATILLIFFRADKSDNFKPREHTVFVDLKSSFHRIGAIIV